jgi:plastocyanin
LGFDHQVPPLPSGEYEGELKFDSSSAFGSSTLTGTIKAAIPEISVTAPQQGVAWERGETVTITWQSDYMPSGANVRLELTGPSSQVMASSVSDSGSFTWTVPTSGIQTGQYRVNVSPVGLPTMAGQSDQFWIGNAPPVQPTNRSPSDGAQGISSTPTLTSSTFTDPNAGDTHLASRWQLRSDTFGTSRFDNPLWDSMTDTLNLQSTTVPSGTLPPMADAETEITVEVGDHFFVPDQINVTRGQKVTLTVKNVGTESHSLYIPELETSTPTIAPGDTATMTFTPRRAGDFSFHCTVSNHEELEQEGTLEVVESTYWWRVRHQDDEGAWSPWSAETSFSIVYNPPISLPAGLLNFQNVLADFRSLSDLTLTYEPLGQDDINLGNMNVIGPAPAAENETPLRYAGVAFDLVARDQDGQLVTEFDQAYTLTVSYEDWQWQNGGIGAEQTLNLYWNRGQGWEPILPCDGCRHDWEENVIVARLDHLTQFALMGRPPARKAFIPIAIR